MAYLSEMKARALTPINFDLSPELLEQPDGRGVFLMRKLADELFFHDGGRCVEMYFSVVVARPKNTVDAFDLKRTNQGRKSLVFWNALFQFILVDYFCSNSL